MRVLVVEDDSVLRSNLKQQLIDTGFGVDIAADGEEGLFAGLNYPIDLAIVDLGLPKLPGLEVIRAWRAKQRSFPILILTGRAAWQDRIEGLDAGADDYVAKPFVFDEIMARVRAVTRRMHGWVTPVLDCGPYALNTSSRTLTVNGARVELTSFEYRLLEHLMLCAGRTLSGTVLAEHMYGEEVERESNIVAQLIYRLRGKLDPLGAIKPIETVARDGYRFAIPPGAPATIGGRKW